MGAGDTMSVRAAYHRLYCEAYGDRLESAKRGEPMAPSIERRMWSAVHSVLAAYLSSDNINGLGEPETAMPIEVAGFVHSVIGDLLTGRMPPTLLAVTRSGAPEYTAVLNDATDAAVLYANAALSGIINDRSPAKTVRSKFGIAPRTWKEWRKRADPDKTAPDRFYPELENEKRASLLLSGLDRAAAQYRFGGGRPDGSAGGASKG